jgi:hypothetical protein
MIVVFNNSFQTSNEMHFISITKLNKFMLFREIIGLMWASNDALVHYVGEIRLQRSRSLYT